MQCHPIQLCITGEDNKTLTHFKNALLHLCQSHNHDVWIRDSYLLEVDIQCSSRVGWLYLVDGCLQHCNHWTLHISVWWGILLECSVCFVSSLSCNICINLQYLHSVEELLWVTCSGAFVDCLVHWIVEFANGMASAESCHCYQCIICIPLKVPSVSACIVLYYEYWQSELTVSHF